MHDPRYFPTRDATVKQAGRKSTHYFLVACLGKSSTTTTGHKGKKIDFFIIPVTRLGWLALTQLTSLAFFSVRSRCLLYEV